MMKASQPQFHSFSLMSQESEVIQVFDSADKSPSDLQEHGVILWNVFGRNLLGPVLFKYAKVGKTLHFHLVGVEHRCAELKFKVGSS